MADNGDLEGDLDAGVTDGSGVDGMLQEAAGQTDSFAVTLDASVAMLERQAQEAEAQLREEEVVETVHVEDVVEGEAPPPSLYMDSEEEENAMVDSEAPEEPGSASARRRRKYADEDISSPGWSRHRKHVFVLSSAGKPIYARYGDESKLSSFAGVLQAIISFVKDNNDTIQYITAGKHVFQFYTRGAMYYVSVARTGEPPKHLELMLEYLHWLIVSILTGPYIEKLFRERPQFDLRRMLGGTESLIDSLIDSMDSDPSFMLGAAQCLRLSQGVRTTVGEVLRSVKVEGLLYALLVAAGHLVTLVRPKSRGLHPTDLLLVMNFVKSSNTLRDSDSSWTPFCLPHFNDTGHLHVYGRFIHEELCLLLISTDVESFSLLSQCREVIYRELESNAGLEAIKDAMAHQHYSVAETEIPGLLHFLYKSNSTRQYTAPALEAPYVNSRERNRLFRLYQHTLEKVHVITKSVKIYYQVSDSETILAWVTGSFELYVVFGPLVPKALAITSCNKLLRWIKKEESFLFVLNSPVW